MDEKLEITESVILRTDEIIPYDGEIYNCRREERDIKNMSIQELREYVKSVKENEEKIKKHLQMCEKLLYQ